MILRSWCKYIVAISSLSSLTFSFYTSTHVLTLLSALSWVGIKQLLRLYSGACPCYIWTHFFFNFFIFLLKMIYFNWNRITVYVCITVMVFDICINMNQPHENMCLSILNTTQTSLVTPCFWVLPQHKSWVHLSCIELALAISFIYGNVPVSMLCSQIIPSLNSPIESKSLLFICGSSLLASM